jgi:hypothetical protein
MVVQKLSAKLISYEGLYSQATPHADGVDESTCLLSRLLLSRDAELSSLLGG